MNASNIRRSAPWRPLAVALLTVVALLALQGRASAQIQLEGWCREFPVDISSSSYLGLLPYPIGVAVHYTGLNGGTANYQANGPDQISLVPGTAPGWGVPSSIDISLPGGNNVTLPLNSGPQVYHLSYTDPISRRSMLYTIEIKFDERGCPYLVITCDVLIGVE